MYLDLVTGVGICLQISRSPADLAIDFNRMRAVKQCQIGYNCRVYSNVHREPHKSFCSGIAASQKERHSSQPLHFSLLEHFEIFSSTFTTVYCCACLTMGGSLSRMFM